MSQSISRPREFGMGRRLRSIGRLVYQVNVLWEPRDLWVGIYHRRIHWGSPGMAWGRTFYVCLIPCVPIKVGISWRAAR